MQPTRANRGLLPAGTVLDGWWGTIVDQSDTAYLVEIGSSREWLSFDQVHGAPAPVLIPLVVVR